MNTYFLDVAERATKTAAQSAVGIVGAGTFGVLDVDWPGIASASALAAVLSVLTSIASSGFGRGNGTASTIPSVTTTQGRHRA
ncbi:holin [Rhodococcus qingshengii]|nr:hypothetical protein AWH04_08960 [Rhodococcus erythropolis]